MHGAGLAHGHVGGLLRPEAALLHEHGQPEAARVLAAAGLPAVAEPVGLADGGREQGRVVAGVQDQVGAQGADRALVRHLGWREEVPHPQPDGVDAELAGGHVEQVLARRRALEPARRPVGAARCLVGEHHPHPAPVGGHPVRAGEHGGGEFGHRDAVGAAVGAVVLGDVVGQAQDPALVVEGGGDAVVLLAGVVHRHQVLGPVLGPLDGAGQFHGEPRDEEVLGVELAADPEPAARVDRVHADQRLVDAEHVRQQVAVPHRDLGHAEDVQLAPVRGGHGQQAAGLERHAAVAADGELDPDDVRGGGEGGVGVAVAAGEFGRHVRVVVLDASGIEHRRPFGDVDLDQLGGVLAGVRVVADDDGERLAHVADGVRGQDRLQEVAEIGAGDGEPDRDDQARREVVRRDDGRDAGGLDGLGDVEPADLPVRGPRPDDPGPQLARSAEVVAEPAAAAQQAGVLMARQPGADHGHAWSAGFGPPGSRDRRARAVASTASMMPW